MLRRRLNCINGTKSPSSRRAWIEIQAELSTARSADVALLAEGVDRNKEEDMTPDEFAGRPPRGGRG